MEGGRDVPLSKIIPYYTRSLVNCAQAVRFATAPTFTTTLSIMLRRDTKNTRGVMPFIFPKA
jgi:hypothetical protein